MIEKLSLDQLHRVSVEEFRSLPKLPLVICLDNIRSAMNVGSFFRTADAFLVERLILGGYTATPPHKEITKTAIGATDSVEWVHDEYIVGSLQEYKNLGYQIAAVEQTTNSIPLQEVKIRDGAKLVLVFGNEVSGVQDEILRMADFVIEVPQFGTKHSLNVAVCGGIVMWHCFQSMRF